MIMALVGLVMILNVLCGLVIFAIGDAPFYGRAFDRAVWVENRNNDHMVNRRGPMAKDLQRRLHNEKPTKAEVLALLGEPDGMSEWDKRRSDFLGYDVGLGIGIDYHSLAIYFDKNDRVSRVCIIKH